MGRGGGWVATGVLMLGLAPAQAGEGRFAVSGNAGWSFTNAVVWHGGTAANSLAWDAGVGYHLTPKLDIGLLWDRQTGTLPFGPFGVGELRQEGYHAYAAYDLGPPRSLRPFLLAGAGASRRTEVRFAGTRRYTESTELRPSLALGAGLTAHAGHTVALRLGARWTATVVDHWPSEVACFDPGGCWPFPGQSRLSSRFDLAAGALLRF